MDIIQGGITSPKGFKASGIYAGIKKNNQKDLALIYSETTCAAAGVFTKNVIKGHSLKLTMRNIKDGTAQAILINSGNANACIGEQGDIAAKTITESLSLLLKCQKEDVLFGSTGVIGIPLDTKSLLSYLPKSVEALSCDGGHLAAEAIMTTDTYSKELAATIMIDGKKVTIGGMAKGSGMIHPNMATMIGVITTDIDISSRLLDKALKLAVSKTFNRVSVDGDTSVCDKVLILANKMAENTKIELESDDFYIFVDALTKVCELLAKQVAADGEGATKLVEVVAENLKDEDDAYKVVASVAKSPLVKTALFGNDANWGRIITAAGYSTAIFDPDKVDIFIGNILVCKDGKAVSFDEDRAKDILSQKEVTIKLDFKCGTFSDRIWTCDFSYDYVKINGSYRS